jgi:hypothetical protein
MYESEVGSGYRRVGEAVAPWSLHELALGLHELPCLPPSRRLILHPLYFSVFDMEVG